MGLFRELADAGTSVLCVTHNVEHLGCCTKVIVLHRGQCLFEGAPEEALAHFNAKTFTEST